MAVSFFDVVERAECGSRSPSGLTATPSAGGRREQWSGFGNVCAAPRSRWPCLCFFETRYHSLTTRSRVQVQNLLEQMVRLRTSMGMPLQRYAV